MNYAIFSMNMLFFASIGIVVLSISTIGFGAGLSTDPAFNLIGASDNNVVNAARGNLTEIVWDETISPLGVIEMDQLTFTVGNEDTVDSHVFQICAIVEGPIGVFSPSADDPPECVTTSSMPASSKLTGQIITFADAVVVANIVDFSFSIEELS